MAAGGGGRRERSWRGGRGGGEGALAAAAPVAGAAAAVRARGREGRAYGRRAYGLRVFGMACCHGARAKPKPRLRLAPSALCAVFMEPTATRKVPKRANDASGLHCSQCACARQTQNELSLRLVHNAPLTPNSCLCLALCAMCVCIITLNLFRPAYRTQCTAYARSCPGQAPETHRIARTRIASRTQCLMQTPNAFILFMRRSCTARVQQTLPCRGHNTGDHTP